VRGAAGHSGNDKRRRLHSLVLGGLLSSARFHRVRSLWAVWCRYRGPKTEVGFDRVDRNVQQGV